MGAEELPRCPTASSSLASQSPAGAAMSVTFKNSAGTHADLLWLDAFGKETLIQPIANGASAGMNSFVGHAWRIRAKDSGVLLLEHRLESSDLGGSVEIRECRSGPSTAEREDDRKWRKAHGAAALIKAGCPLDTLLSVRSIKGLHVMCVTQSETGAPERLCIFKDGADKETCSHSVVLRGDETLGELADTVMSVIAPRWQPKPRAPMPAFFSASGRRLPTDQGLQQVGVPEYRQALVLMQGGEWHWPPVREGFERPLHGFVRSGAGHITMRTLSVFPRVFEVKSFIEEMECDRMLEKAGPHVQKSEVVLKDQDRHKENVDEWRTSFNHFLQSAGDPVLEAMDHRVQNLTRISILHSELPQILKYTHQGRYDAHTDFFDPKDYARDQRTLEMTANGVHNRLLTVFMYMTNVEKGGETFFPFHNRIQHPVNYSDCGRGFAVRPERQKVIIFYNLFPDGSFDEASLHGGCRVLEGTKWSANYWVWNVPQAYKSSYNHQRMGEEMGFWDPVADRAEEAIITDLAASLHKKVEL